MNDEQLLAVVNDEELLKLITRAYYYAGVPDAKRMAVAFIASQQDSESGGMLAPDAVATYAAMLKAVEKPCPNDPPCEHSEDDHDPCAGSRG